MERTWCDRGEDHGQQVLFKWLSEVQKHQLMASIHSRFWWTLLSWEVPSVHTVSCGHRLEVRKPLDSHGTSTRYGALLSDNTQ